MSSIAANGGMAQAAAEPARSALVLRIASAALLAPAALALTVLGGWAFTLLVAAVGVLMGLEWDRLTGGGRGAPAALQALAPPVAAVLALTSGLAAAVLATAAAALVLALCAPGRRGWAALGAVWFALPCGALVWLRNDASTGLQAALWILLLVWAADTLAYVFGRWLGGPKLAPRISPKKTWAGLGGAVLGAALVGAAGSAVTGLAPAPAAIAASGLAGAIGQAGDLAESAVKRRFGVKDSGAIIPGHGGVLDRVDALLFVVLAATGLALVNGGALLPWR